LFTGPTPIDSYGVLWLYSNAVSISRLNYTNVTLGQQISFSNAAIAINHHENFPTTMHIADSVFSNLGNTFSGYSVQSLMVFRNNVGSCGDMGVHLTIQNSNFSWLPTVHATKLRPAISAPLIADFVADVTRSSFDYPFGTIFDFPSYSSQKPCQSQIPSVFLHEDVSITSQTTMVECGAANVAGSSATSFCGASSYTFTFGATLFMALISSASILVLILLLVCAVCLKRSRRRNHYHDVN
jgi:hypothetical protein